MRKKLTFVPIIDGTLRPGNLILRPENECSASNYSNMLVLTLPIFLLLPQPDFFKFHLRRMSQSIYLKIINSIDFCERNWSFDIFINWMWKWYLACVCVCVYVCTSLFSCAHCLQNKNGKGQAGSTAKYRRCVKMGQIFFVYHKLTTASRFIQILSIFTSCACQVITLVTLMLS